MNYNSPASWTIQQVQEWLSREGLSEHAATFRRKGIDGKQLITLSRQDIKNVLEIPLLSERKQVAAAVERIKKLSQDSSPRRNAPAERLASPRCSPQARIVAALNYSGEKESERTSPVSFEGDSSSSCQGSEAFSAGPSDDSNEMDTGVLRELIKNLEQQEDTPRPTAPVSGSLFSPVGMSLPNHLPSPISKLTPPRQSGREGLFRTMQPLPTAHSRSVEATSASRVPPPPPPRSAGYSPSPRTLPNNSSFTNLPLRAPPRQEDIEIERARQRDREKELEKQRQKTRLETEQREKERAKEREEKERQRLKEQEDERLMRLEARAREAAAATPAKEPEADLFIEGPSRVPSMIHYPTKYMIPPQALRDKGKLVVVLDLDETLVHCLRWPGPITKRPCIDALFEFLGANCETIVWTAGIRVYAQAVVKTIDRFGIIRHCIYRHTKWFEDQDYTKDLTLLGRDLAKTIIIENTPDCIIKNMHNGIIVPDYTHNNPLDQTLTHIKTILQKLVTAMRNDPSVIVQDFVQKCEDLELRTAQNYKGESIGCYCLKYRPP
eukprot:TRINITY_DN1926_c0_g1_i1.p1 TRINITY_DN1926_c0_g1~~TRINITY_DN1926_c0_g1_i1.p1  ORF type:complete len:552 (+),score=78.41 TRINITY_DN1926_c0_g1_i1:1105-2760(+)